MHSIAEMYAALTQLPVQPRIHLTEAARTISDNILPHFESVSVGKKDYTEALARWRARLGRSKNIGRAADWRRGQVGR